MKDATPPMAGDSLTSTRSALALAESSEPEQPQQAEWLRYLAAVRRFGWLVLAVTLAATGLGVGAAMLLPPSYVTQAIVWIRVPNKEVRNEGPIWQGQLPISSGWIELLQSYAVLDHAVRSRRLYLHAAVPGDSDVLGTLGVKEHVLPGDYRLVVDDDTVPPARFTLFAGSSRDPVARGAAGDSVGPDLGLAWVPPTAALARGRQIKFTLDAPYEAALKLADQLKVSADLDGNFLRLQLGGRDPVATAATVNAVAERFVAVAAGLKRDNLSELTGILGTQLQDGQAALRRAEDALRAFRVGAVTTLAEGAGSVAQNTQYQRDPLFAGLVEMKVSLDEIRRDRVAIERLLRQGLDSGVSVDALAMVGAVQHSTELVQALRDLTAKQAELRALRGHYTDDNPPVRRAAVEAEALSRSTIPALASSLAAELRVRETELGQRVATASSGLKQVPPLAVEEARLQRDVTLAEQAVSNLQQRRSGAAHHHEPGQERRQIVRRVQSGAGLRRRRPAHAARGRRRAARAVASHARCRAPPRPHGPARRQRRVGPGGAGDRVQEPVVHLVRLPQPGRAGPAELGHDGPPARRRAHQVRRGPCRQPCPRRGRGRTRPGHGDREPGPGAAGGRQRPRAHGDQARRADAPAGARARRRPERRATGGRVPLLLLLSRGLRSARRAGCGSGTGAARPRRGAGGALAAATGAWGGSRTAGSPPGRPRLLPRRAARAARAPAARRDRAPRCEIPSARRSRRAAAAAVPRPRSRSPWRVR